MPEPYESVNEYGTPITVFVCEFCGNEFSVCPAVPPTSYDQWTGCTLPECVSYDPERDGDKLLDFGMVKRGGDPS